MLFIYLMILCCEYLKTMIRRHSERCIYWLLIVVSMFFQLKKGKRELKYGKSWDHNLRLPRRGKWFYHLIRNSLIHKVRRMKYFYLSAMAFIPYWVTIMILKLNVSCRNTLHLKLFVYMGVLCFQGWMLILLKISLHGYTITNLKQKSTVIFVGFCWLRKHQKK